MGIDHKQSIRNVLRFFVNKLRWECDFDEYTKDRIAENLKSTGVHHRRRLSFRAALLAKTAPVVRLMRGSQQPKSKWQRTDPVDQT